MIEHGAVVAMSGGVDSSTAAVLLKEAGFDLVGFSMRLWDPRRSGAEEDAPVSGRCCSLEDFYDAREVAARLGIPYYVIDFQREFEFTVIRAFIDGYRNGLTPSPCVLCNSRMKFEHLVRLAGEVGAPRVATGHYARVSYDARSGRHFLLRARDTRKDQSYFLFELDQSQLSKALFPLGDLEKGQVRQIARRRGLPVADKRDSQEICFVPDGDYAAFIERHCPPVAGAAGRPRAFSPGRIVDIEGRILGAHPGIHHFTVGQRRGLGIAHSEPLYVLELRPEENQVVVGKCGQLLKRRCRAVRPNWISIAALKQPVRVHAQIRSQHPAAPATISPHDDGSVEVAFDAPQAAVAPGQACVFYQGERVVGGGWIDRD